MCSCRLRIWVWLLPLLTDAGSLCWGEVTQSDSVQCVKCVLCDVTVKDLVCACVCVSECEGEKERQHHSLKEWSRFHIFCQVISVWIKFGIKPGVMFGSEWQWNVKLFWIKCSMFGSLLNVNVRAVEHYCYTFEFVHRSITETWLQQKDENCTENMKLQGEIRLSVSIRSFATVHSLAVFQQKNVQM